MGPWQQPMRSCFQPTELWFQLKGFCWSTESLGILVPVNRIVHVSSQGILIAANRMLIAANMIPATDSRTMVAVSRILVEDYRSLIAIITVLVVANMILVVATESRVQPFLIAANESLLQLLGSELQPIGLITPIITILVSSNRTFS
jgi:hypothetical protein